MNILIVKLSSIGDVVHTLPSLSALRKLYPSARIDWIVEKEAGDILAGNTLIDNLFVIKKNGWVKDFNETYTIAKQIRSVGYDIVLDFQGLLKSGIWVFISGGGRRIGFDKTRELSHFFLNEKLPPYNPDKHAVDRYLDLVASLGNIGTEVEFPVFISDGEKKRVSALLKDAGILSEMSFVVVSPQARWKSKLWGDEKFAGVCNEIIKWSDCRVIIVGMKGAADKILTLADNRIVDFTGKTTLRELAYLMSLSRAVVTVDSGPMHIAAAMGAPVISIFGPTAPWRTGPYGKGHVVIRRAIQCSPCFMKKCDKMTCMDEIKIKDVVEAVKAGIQA